MSTPIQVTDADTLHGGTPLDISRFERQTNYQSAAAADVDGIIPPGIADSLRRDDVWSRGDRIEGEAPKRIRSLPPIARQERD